MFFQPPPFTCRRMNSVFLAFTVHCNALSVLPFSSLFTAMFRLFASFAFFFSLSWLYFSLRCSICLPLLLCLSFAPSSLPLVCISSTLHTPSLPVSCSTRVPRLSFTSPLSLAPQHMKAVNSRRRRRPQHPVPCLWFVCLFHPSFTSIFDATAGEGL